jgi:hypothetical protein
MTPQINNYKDIIKLPLQVRVIDDTHELAGYVFNVRSRDYKNKQIKLWVEVSDGYFDDEVLSYDQVQFLTPVFHGDYQIGIGDKIKNSGDLCEVFGYEIQHGSLALSCAIECDYCDTYYYYSEEVQSVTPLYNPKKETQFLSGTVVTLSIGGEKYEAVIK